MAISSYGVPRGPQPLLIDPFPVGDDVHVRVPMASAGCGPLYFRHDRPPPDGRFPQFQPFDLLPAFIQVIEQFFEGIARGAPHGEGDKQRLFGFNQARKGIGDLAGTDLPAHEAEAVITSAAVVLNLACGGVLIDPDVVAAMGELVQAGGGRFDFFHGGTYPASYRLPSAMFPRDRFEIVGKPVER